MAVGLSLDSTEKQHPDRLRCVGVFVYKFIDKNKPILYNVNKGGYVLYTDLTDKDITELLHQRIRDVDVLLNLLGIKISGKQYHDFRKRLYELNQLQHYGLDRKETYTIEQVMPHLLKRQGEAVFDGDSIRLFGNRYGCFINSGLKCHACGLEGTVFIKEKHRCESIWHFNLYGYNEQGNEVLFTKDHIIPRSRGGSNKVENLKTMCRPCNEKKNNIDRHSSDVMSFGVGSFKIADIRKI